MFIVKVHKSGGSYAVVIPKGYLARFNLIPKDYVVIELRDDAIVIKPLRKYPKPKKKLRKEW